MISYIRPRVLSALQSRNFKHIPTRASKYHSVCLVEATATGDATQRTTWSHTVGATVVPIQALMLGLIQRVRHSNAALLSIAVVAPNASVWSQLGSNYIFMVGFWGWFIAQFLKIFTKWYKSGVFSLRAFVDSGGMPSSHSALCSSVTTAIALQQGLASPLFSVALCFSVIVMYDAMGVRRHAGLQAEVLNAVVQDLLEGHPMSERKLKEVLGHTPRQVLAGAILGLIVGLLHPRPF